MFLLAAVPALAQPANRIGNEAIVVTSASNSSPLFGLLADFAAASQELTGTQTRVRYVAGDTVETRVQRALNMLRSGQADIAVVEMAAIADKPILGYSLQPFLGRTLSDARRLDLSMRRHIERVLENDLSLTLLGTMPQLPRVVVNRLATWDGTFRPGQILTLTRLEADGFNRLEISPARYVVLTEVAERMRADESVHAVVPLELALTLVREHAFLHVHDLRTAYPALAIVRRKGDAPGSQHPNLALLDALAKDFETLSWKRIATLAEDVLHAARIDRIRIGVFEPRAPETMLRLVDRSLGQNARNSISEVVQAYARSQVDESVRMIASAQPSPYGRWCRNLEILLITNRALPPAADVRDGEMLPQRGRELRAELSTRPHFGVVYTQVSARSFDMDTTYGECVDYAGRRTPDRGFELHRVKRLSRAAFSEAAQAHPPGYGSPPPYLVFVHGYRVTFEQAVETVAELSVLTRNRFRPVLISWPSAGRYGAYGSDGERADKSIHTVTEAVELLGSVDPRRAIHFVAHSMGNRIVLGGLTKLRAAGGTGSALLQELVTVAPDVQCDQYRNAMKAIQQPGGSANRMFRRASLYLYEKDYALTAAEVVRFLRPPNEQCRIGNQRGYSASAIADVEVIDWSCMREIADSHSYYIANDYISRDLREILRHSTPSDRDLERIDTSASDHFFLHARFKSSDCLPRSTKPGD